MGGKTVIQTHLYKYFRFSDHDWLSRPDFSLIRGDRDGQILLKNNNINLQPRFLAGIWQNLTVSISEQK
jgi:hypothetical protein